MQTWSFRGSKSRNKVSVGEPAEGSLLFKTQLWVCEVARACACYWACFWNSTLVCRYRFYVTHIERYTLLITQKLLNKNFSGGSLGSYVDEGRSKMRELVWIAGHIEHRYSERKLQSEACLHSTPVWGSLLNPSNLHLLGWACDWQQSLALVWTLRGSTGSWSVCRSIFTDCGVRTSYWVSSFFDLRSDESTRWI